jgi:hypothetical protein
MQHSRPNLPKLLVASCCTLVAELALIRRLSTEVRIFAMPRIWLCCFAFSVSGWVVPWHRNASGGGEAFWRSAALAASMLGAVAGGLMENLSPVVGLKTFLLIPALFYPVAGIGLRTAVVVQPRTA